MFREERDAALRADEEFRNSVFANNPDLYRHLFPPVQHIDPESPDFEPDFEVEEMVPETEADVQKMLDMLKRSGALD